MITVRLATLDDAEAIAHHTSNVQRLHSEALPDIFKPESAELFPPQKLATLIQDPNGIVAVAEIQGKIVGHICGAVVNRTENAFHQPDTYIYIQQIGVDDAARRQGAGTALVAFIRDRARSLGLTTMQVDHWAFNTRARDFFEACGFTPMKVTMRCVLKDDEDP